MTKPSVGDAVTVVDTPGTYLPMLPVPMCACGHH